MMYEPRVPKSIPSSYINPNGFRCRFLRFLYRLAPFSLKGDLNEALIKPSRPIISCMACVSNRPLELENLLSDLARQEIDKSLFEVIILNDGGGEQIRAIVDRFLKILPIKYKEHSTSLKVIGHLRNLTIEMSEGQYLLFLDDDTRIFHSNFLTCAIEIFQKENPDVIIPYGESLFGIVRLKYDFFDHFSFGNAGVLYKREVLLRAGGFKNDLPSYEDIELGLRLSILGVNILKTAKLIYLHPPFYFDSMQKPLSIGASVQTLRKHYSFLVWLVVFFNAMRFLPFGIIPDLRYQQWFKISLGVLLAAFSKKNGVYYDGKSAIPDLRLPAASQKIQITTIRYSIRNRGGDRRVLDYFNYLAENGHDVTHWTREVNTAFLISPQIKIKKIPFPGILGTILFSMTKQFKTDILLVDLAIMAFFCYRRNKQNLLFLAQDDDVSYYKSIFFKWITRHSYHRVLNRWGIPTIAVSEGLSQTLAKYKPKNIFVIPHGIDLNIFFTKDYSPYISYKKSPRTILLFARSDYRKGLDIAIKAIEELRRIQVDSNWEIWTIGPQKVRFPAGVPIRNYGFISDEKKLSDILNAADIFLVPSRSEGLGLLLLQAMACECAIITTAASTIIVHELNGLVSPIEDWKSLAQNMKCVLDDPQLLRRLKTASRELAKQYDSKVSKERFLKYLENFQSHS